MASVNGTRDGVASAIDYSRWDTFGDSDDEARAAKEKADKLADTRRKALAANAPKPPKVDWSKIKLDDPATLGQRCAPSRAASVSAASTLRVRIAILLMCSVCTLLR